MAHAVCRQRGIQSIEVGGQLLLALAGHGRPMALKDLSSAAGMSPARAHPYLVSFAKIGLVARDADSGRYGLGPLAMQLGLISLQQSDPLRLATSELPALARAIGQTVGITVWGSGGPTVVRTELPQAAIHVSVRHGAVMSLEGTASGRLFAAYMPREQITETLGDIDFTERFEHELARIRADGLSSVRDAALQGISGLAAPVFDANGKLVIGLIAVGPSLLLDIAPDGGPATQLRTCARLLTAQLAGNPSA